MEQAQVAQGPGTGSGIGSRRGGRGRGDGFLVPAPVDHE
jgi:hypothetical protein